MNLQDQLHDALVSRPRGCNRCGGSFHGARLVVLYWPNEWLYLCPACVVDFEWFMQNPPEQPSVSSDTVLGTTPQEVE